MKAAYKVFACLIALFAMAAVAGIASAETQTITVAAGGTNTVNLGGLSEGDGVFLTWTTSSTTPVSAVLTGPQGFTDSFGSSYVGFETIDIPHDGAYLLTFSNAGSSSASVTVDWTVTPFSPGGFFDDLVTIVLIIAIVIVVVIVLIVVLVLMSGKKKKQQSMAAAAPQGIVTPTTPGMCPVCGSQTDTNAPFCAKCGAKFR